MFSEGSTELTSGVRSGDRGQEVVDERGQLLESPSPNVVSLDHTQNLKKRKKCFQNMKYENKK